MSQGPPPPSNLYGFGPVAVGSMNSVAVEPPDAVMMPDLDDAAFEAYHGLPMVLDGNDDLTMSSYPPMGAADPQNTMLALNDVRIRTGLANENLVDRGPQPASLDSQAPANANANVPSTLTEFTKKKNWPATVVGELRDFLHILNSDGRITHVSPSVVALTGYAAEEIVGRFLKDYIHSDDVGVFVAELNESIASGNPLRMFYRLRRKDGSYATFEAVGHAHIAAAKFAPNPNNQSPFCQAVFMMSRPYPTKNANLLDSFLEHTVENERLKRRIAELRKEEAEDADEAQRAWRQSQEGRSDIAPSEDTMATGSTSATVYHATGEGSMAPPDRASAMTLTRENLEGMAGIRPDSIRDKMARYEGVTHTDTIEMLTGLRYTEGERSRGISTGNGSPMLIKGDAGIAIPLDRDSRTGDKKKKLRVAEEYVCTDCGTLESPEWRKGPSGPKTLCNACGLRWAKKEKKKGSGAGGPPASVAAG